MRFKQSFHFAAQVIIIAARLVQERGAVRTAHLDSLSENSYLAACIIIHRILKPYSGRLNIFNKPAQYMISEKSRQKGQGKGEFFCEGLFARYTKMLANVRLPRDSLDLWMRKPLRENAQRNFVVRRQSAAATALSGVITIPLLRQKLSGMCNPSVFAAASREKKAVSPLRFATALHNANKRNLGRLDCLYDVRPAVLELECLILFQ